jgi:hypothetical protein
MCDEAFEPDALAEQAALRSYEEPVLYRGTAAWEGDEEERTKMRKAPLMTAEDCFKAGIAEITGDTPEAIRDEICLTAGIAAATLDTILSTVPTGVAIKIGQGEDLPSAMKNIAAGCLLIGARASREYDRRCREENDNADAYR